MIRNTVIHLANEQPLMADLFALPTPGDVSLVCTNLRTLNGKRPVFADRSESVFVFPYAHIRFLEIAPESVAALGEGAPGSAAGANGQGGGAGDLLAAVRSAVSVAADATTSAAATERRVAAHGTAAADGPVAGDGGAEGDGAAAADGPLAGDATAAADDLDQELELDEEFLRRIREV